MNIKYLAIVFVALAGGAWYSQISFAQSSAIGASVSPVSFELNADPGDTVSNQVKVYNPTDEAITIKMRVEDFVTVGDKGQVALIEPGERSSYSLAAWGTVSPDTFILPPKQQQIVSYTIQVPLNAEPGGHYGSIVASNAAIPNDSVQVSGSQIGIKAGSLLLMRVSGDVREDLVLSQFEAPSFSQYGPVEFKVKFKNVGNVHTIPAGFITITDQFGNSVAQLEVPQRNVIPGSEREANVTWNVENTVGYYTATLVATFGSGTKQNVSGTTTFTVFPLNVALVILAIALIILFILFLGRQRLRAAMIALRTGQAPVNSKHHYANYR